MRNKLNNFSFKALLIAQFLEAFNDNAFKVVVSFITIDFFTQTKSGSLYLALSGCVFVLPFLLFSAYAGYLADRFSKRNILIIAKFAEILIMLLGLFALKNLHIESLLFVLFLMGTHSAFFSPAKYGILPEMLDIDQLSTGNGWMQMGTYAAIILGQAVGGYLLHIFGVDIYKTGYVFIIVSILGFIISLMIQKTPTVKTIRAFNWNIFKEIKTNFSFVKSQRSIFLSIVGLVYFSFLGGLFQPTIMLYARQLMTIDHLKASSLLIFLSVGIGLGSVLAGRFSDQKIELGLVPLGAFGLSFFAIKLGFVYHWYFSVVITLFLLGIFSGFYIVPLNALIQQQSPQDSRGQVIALNNFFSFTAILIASVAVYIFRDIIHINPAQIFIFIGLLTILGAIYICRLLPYPLVRLFVWILTHTIYKVRIINKEVVPQKGGALFVANHVSLVDALLIVVSTTRPVRFMMNRQIYQLKWLNPILKIANAIPVTTTDKPKELVKSLNVAKEAIKNGEIVCIFPEGQLTRTGNLLKFNKGFEHIVKDLDCPIIPIHLDRIWGSIFSFERGKYYWKIPKIIPYPVTVSFGDPLPSSTSAFDVRQKVQELGADAFKYRFADQKILPEAFLHEARKHVSKFCISDFTGKKLSYGQTLLSSIVFSKIFLNKFKEEKYVGLLLPPSIAGVLSNIALGFADKIAVNINYTASKDSIDSIVKQCSLRKVLSSKVFLEKSKVQLSCDVIFVEDLLKEITLWQKVEAAVLSYVLPSFISRRAILKNIAKRSNQDLATIMFTSGSTGEPKGVMLTHANVMSNLEGLYQVFALKNNDTILGILPFFHSFGFTGTLWFPLISGIGAVYHANPLDVKTVGKLVQEHQITLMMATPTFLNMYHSRCQPEQFKSLRLVMVGAEKLKETLSKAFEEKFGIVPMEGYGCTELSPIGAVNLPDFDAQGPRQKAHKLGTIGLPLPGTVAKIVDPENLQPLGKDQNGLLLIKGPHVMKGYLNKEEKTKDVIVNGWYKTGDIANIDEDGFITITDRLSRFSKIGGEMVPHIKIEEAIHKLLNATEQICVVTSIADEKKGEKLVVLYVADFNVEDIIKGLQAAGLPNLWIPESKMFFKVDHLPLLGTGKLDLSSIKHKAQACVQSLGNG